MNPGFTVRFRPSGPWRIGPDTGARDRVDRVFHSDALFSAVSHAMSRFGRLDEWLAATVTSGTGPAVRLSSLFPALDDILFVPPPKSLWPPPPSAKVRWRNARFVPLSVARDLAAEKPLNDNRWYLDGPSGCLMPADPQFRSGPFRASLRSQAAVDRLSAASVDVHRTACLEFSDGGGFWGVVSFANEEAKAQWSGPLQAAFRYLADTGLGGERSLGWGRSAQPEFAEGRLSDLILPEREPAEGSETAWWLLSLFSPAEQDTVDWRRGCYELADRGGRIDSPARSGESKKVARMVEEGSVLVAAAPLTGAAPDVAPPSFPHPVYRAGFALAFPIPLRQGAAS